MSVKISSIRKAAVVLKTGGRCAYCGEHLYEHNLHFDHVIPKSKGGKNCAENLVAACDTCNRCKGTKSVDEFRLTQSMKLSGHGIAFSLAQLVFLDSHGVLEELLGDYYYHTFYFEHAGIPVVGVK